MLKKKKMFSISQILRYSAIYLLIFGILQSTASTQAGSVPSPYFEYTPYVLNVRSGEQYNYSGTYHAELTGSVVTSGTTMPLDSHYKSTNFTESYYISDVNNYSAQIKYQKSHSDEIMEKNTRNGENRTVLSSNQWMQNQTIQYDNKYETYFTDPFVLTQNLTLDAITNHSYMFTSQTVNNFGGFLLNDQNQMESNFEGSLSVQEIIDSDSIRVDISNTSESWANWQWAYLYFASTGNHSKLIFRIREINPITADILEFTVENNPTQNVMNQCNISLNERAVVLFGFNFYDRTTIIGKGLQENVLIAQGGHSLYQWINNYLWLFPSSSSSTPSVEYCIENVTTIDDISFIYLDRPVENINFDSDAWIVEKWDRDYAIYQSQLLDIYSLESKIQISKPLNGNPHFAINQYIIWQSDNNNRLYYIRTVEEGLNTGGDYWNLTLGNMYDFQFQLNDNITIYSRNEILVKKYALATLENQNEGVATDFSDGIHEAYTKSLFSHPVPPEDMPVYSGNKSDFNYTFQKAFSHFGAPRIEPLGVGIGVFSETSQLQMKMNEKFVISEIYLQVIIILNATFGDYRVIYRIELEYSKKLISANYIPIPLPSNPILPTPPTNTTNNMTAMPLGVLIGGGVIIFGASSGGTTLFLYLYYRKRMVGLKKPLGDLKKEFTSNSQTDSPHKSKLIPESTPVAAFGTTRIRWQAQHYFKILGIAGLVTAFGLGGAFLLGADATDIPWFGMGTLANLTLGENWILYISVVIGFSFIALTGLFICGQYLFEPRKEEIHPFTVHLKDTMISESIHEFMESYPYNPKLEMIANDIAVFTNPFLKKIKKDFTLIYIYLAAELLGDPHYAAIILENPAFTGDLRNNLLEIITLCKQYNYSPKLG